MSLEALDRGICGYVMILGPPSFNTRPCPTTRRMGSTRAEPSFKIPRPLILLREMFVKNDMSQNQKTVWHMGAPQESQVSRLRGPGVGIECAALASDASRWITPETKNVRGRGSFPLVCSSDFVCRSKAQLVLGGLLEFAGTFLVTVYGERRRMRVLLFQQKEQVWLK